MDTEKRLSHTAVPSRLTKAWHVVKPCVPTTFRYVVRKNLQYLHSRKLTTDDVMLLSYPKSGSTWLRSMLLLIVSENKATPSNLAEWIPPLHMVGHRRFSSPRIVRSHDAIDTPGFSKSSKILVLVRDPRSLVVSYYHHLKRRNISTTIEDCTSELLNHGFDEIGSWKQHVSQAVKMAGMSENVKIVTYESLLENTQAQMSAILDFYKLDQSNVDLAEVIQKCTPDNLRKMRISAGVDLNTPNGSDIRKGSAKGWQDECPTSCIQKIQNQTGKQLEALGYTLI